MGVGQDPAVCVGTRHLEQSGLFGACEHYCNPNVNWNLDLTEVINRCVCVCVSDPTWMAVPAGDGTVVDLLESPPLHSRGLTWLEPPLIFFSFKLTSLTLLLCLSLSFSLLHILLLTIRGFVC